MKLIRFLVVPNLRADAWKLLCDYIPVDTELKTESLERKREEYLDIVKHYFENASTSDTVEQLASKVEDMSPYEVQNFK